MGPFEPLNASNKHLHCTYLVLLSFLASNLPAQGNIAIGNLLNEDRVCII
jgi:hypothetical protein